jgi:hypothetical protein
MDAAVRRRHGLRDDDCRDDAIKATAGAQTRAPMRQKKTALRGVFMAVDVMIDHAPVLSDQ